jgi:hypothetical protein
MAEENLLTSLLRRLLGFKSDPKRIDELVARFRDPASDRLIEEFLIENSGHVRAGTRVDQSAACNRILQLDPDLQLGVLRTALEHFPN